MLQISVHWQLYGRCFARLVPHYLHYVALVRVPSIYRKQQVATLIIHLQPVWKYEEKKRLSTNYKNRYLHHWDNTFTFNRLGKHCAVVSHNNSVSNSISKYACHAWLQTPSNSPSCFNHLSSLLGTGWFQEQFWARFHNHTQINWRPNARSVFNSS